MLLPPKIRIPLTQQRLRTLPNPQTNIPESQATERNKKKEKKCGEPT